MRQYRTGVNVILQVHLIPVFHHILRIREQCLIGFNIFGNPFLSQRSFKLFSVFFLKPDCRRTIYLTAVTLQRNIIFDRHDEEQKG
ncbi:hypothetical protein D3C73_1240420 [compost metagenome]